MSTPILPSVTAAIVSHGIPADTAVTPHLERAEKLFKDFNTATQADKQEITSHLSKAFEELQKICKTTGGTIPVPLLNTAARIFYIYGRCVYGGNMEASRQMFQLSLAIQLIGLRVLDPKSLPSLKDCGDLESFPKHLSETTKAFGKDFDEHLFAFTSPEFAQAVAKGGKEHAFSIATALRWLGHSYQNLDEFKNVNEAIRFEKIYGHAIETLRGIHSHDANWEIVEILYNTTRFMLYLKDSENYEGALKKMEEILPYITEEGPTVRGEQLLAQTHNIATIDRGNIISAIEKGERVPKDPNEKIQLLEQQLKDISQAVRVAEANPGINPKLKDMFIKNRTAIQITCLQAGMILETPVDDIRSSIQDGLKKIYDEDFSHYYDAGDLIVAARFEFSQGNIPAALAYLAKADEINEKFSLSSAVLQERAKTLRDKITAASP